MSKEKEKIRKSTNIAKQQYDFDFELEKSIYSYLYGIDRKQQKKLNDAYKFNDYSSWKQYIRKKYTTYRSKKLMEFSRFLNQEIRGEKPSNAYWNICIPIMMSVLVTNIPKMISDINTLDFTGAPWQAFVLCMIFVIGFVLILLYYIFKIMRPLWDNNTRENILVDYKEIIDEMYEEQHEQELQYQHIQEIAKITIEYAKQHIKAGMSLIEVRKMCEDKMLELGADSFWYYNVGAFVFAGNRTAISLSGKEYKTSEKVIKKNDIITIDLSPQCKNIWGDYARTLIIQNGEVVEMDAVNNQEWKKGLLMEDYLHKELCDFATPQTTFEELYYHMNQLIKEKGFINLDFMGNLGHSIVRQKADRIYIEKGNQVCLGDVAYFTFEPHISVAGSKYGYKKENTYYFDGDELKEL